MIMTTETAENASEFTADFTVDARKQPCPMPILMLKRLLKTIEKNQVNSESLNKQKLILIKVQLLIPMVLPIALPV